MQRPPRTQRPYRQQTTHRSATSRPPPGESAASATPTPVGLSPSFVRITLPGNTRLDKVRGIPLTGMESGSIPWKVPEAGPGHAIVMLETLETARGHQDKLPAAHVIMPDDAILQHRAEE